MTVRIALFALASLALIAPAHAADKRMAGSMPVHVFEKKEEKSETKPEKEAKKAAVSAKTAQAAPETPAEVKKVAMPAQTPVQPVKAALKKGPINYVGEIETYKAQGDDTMLTIGARESLGYVELRSANPSMDPWRPGAGTFMILPKMHLLPDAPRKGIVINLSEMRLYYYMKNGEIKTFPIGVGREGFTTPMGSTTVVSKTKDPTWRPTERMLREDPTLKAVYLPGPDNPLGTRALYLGWPQYRIHGTNKPWGIGRRVSSGCIRMYNANAEYLYDTVPVSTTVTVVRQPIKFAWIGDMLYIEAHPDEMLADQVERVGGAPLDYKVPSDIFANISRAAGSARDNIDWGAVRAALRDRRGYPVPILQGATEDSQFVTAEMIDRAGTSRFGPRLTEEPLEPLVPGMDVGNSHPAEEKPAVPAAAPRRAGSFNG